MQTINNAAQGIKETVQSVLGAGTSTEEVNKNEEYGHPHAGPGVDGPVIVEQVNGEDSFLLSFFLFFFPFPCFLVIKSPFSFPNSCWLPFDLV